MKILICICTYKRNQSLISCLKSFKKVIIPSNFNISFLIVDNTLNFGSFKIIKNFKQKFKFKIIQVNEKKRGIVNARNRCLKESKKINSDYIAFFDDDCEIDKFWFNNFKKLLKKTNSEILTGPQIYRNINNLGYLFEKKIKRNNSLVTWAASNNVIIKKKIISNKKIYFDNNLNKFGMGEDQLFFSKLHRLGHDIIWSKNIKVYEKMHSHRSNSKWVKDRSFRLGVLGSYIDKELYGTINGFLLNYIKCIYYLFFSIFSLLNLIQKNYFYKFLNLFFRSIGRMFGPIVFEKIQFYKK